MLSVWYQYPAGMVVVYAREHVVLMGSGVAGASLNGRGPEGGERGPEGIGLSGGEAKGSGQSGSAASMRPSQSLSKPSPHNVSVAPSGLQTSKEASDQASCRRGCLAQMSLLNRLDNHESPELITFFLCKRRINNCGMHSAEAIRCFNSMICIKHGSLGWWLLQCDALL
jgi:hypothetical protein